MRNARRPFRDTDAQAHRGAGHRRVSVPIRTAFDAIVADRPARVVIDLSELRFIDSSGLSLLLAVADQVAEVELRDPSAMIRKVIGLTGLSSVFVITP